MSAGQGVRSWVRLLRGSAHSSGWPSALDTPTYAESITIVEKGYVSTKVYDRGLCPQLWVAIRLGHDHLRRESIRLVEKA